MEQVMWNKNYLGLTLDKIPNHLINILSNKGNKTVELFRKLENKFSGPALITVYKYFNENPFRLYWCFLWSHLKFFYPKKIGSQQGNATLALTGGNQGKLKRETVSKAQTRVS